MEAKFEYSVPFLALHNSSLFSLIFEGGILTSFGKSTKWKLYTHIFIYSNRFLNMVGKKTAVHAQTCGTVGKITDLCV